MPAFSFQNAVREAAYFGRIAVTFGHDIMASSMTGIPSYGFPKKEKRNLSKF